MKMLTPDEYRAQHAERDKLLNEEIRKRAEQIYTCIGKVLKHGSLSGFCVLRREGREHRHQIEKLIGERLYKSGWRAHFACSSGKLSWSLEDLTIAQRKEEKINKELDRFYYPGDITVINQLNSKLIRYYEPEGDDQ